MIAIVRVIISLIIAVFIQSSVSGMVETDPQDAVNDFMKGISGTQEKVMERYLDNEYVNFLVNLQGSEKDVKRMNEALFDNFSYKIDKVLTLNDVAAAKVTITTNDFSDVMDDYDKASYKYIVDNLYSDSVTDKKKLSAKCLDIYIDQIEKEADKKAKREATVYIPMIDDGYGGWTLIVNNKTMKSILGNLAMPDTK